MAANSVTILKEFQKYVEKLKEATKSMEFAAHAMGYAPGVDIGELDIDDAMKLLQETEKYHAMLLNITQQFELDVSRILEKQTVKWKGLNTPDNHESWMVMQRSKDNLTIIGRELIQMAELDSYDPDDVEGEVANNE